MTRVSIVEIDKETSLAIARPFDFFTRLHFRSILILGLYIPKFILFIIINIQCGESSLLVLSLATRQRPSVLLRNDCAATLD